MRRRHLTLAALAAIVITANLAATGCGTSTVVPVVLPPLSSVTITPSGDTVIVGEQRQFVAEARDTDTVVVAGAKFSWTTSDPGVITVTQSGRVSAVGEGVAFVIASAGGKSDSATVVTYVQIGWYAQTSTTTNDLNGVYFQPNGRDGVAVGDVGTIVRSDDAGQSWILQNSSTTFNLNDVWFTTGETGFAVGSGGTVMRTRNGGTSWSRLLNVPASENLRGLWFSDSANGWVVGVSGTILRTADGGATWTRRNPTALQLNSVSFSGTLDGWAVGEGGVILGTHDGGDSWYVVQPSVTVLSLRGVWRRSATRAWAGGSQGVMPFTAATPESLQWVLGTFGASNVVNDLQFLDDLTGYAVGTNGQGMVLKTLDGGVTWGPQLANSIQTFHDVHFVDGLRGWAVGQAGRIIHTSRGGH